MTENMVREFCKNAYVFNLAEGLVKIGEVTAFSREGHAVSAVVDDGDVVARPWAHAVASYVLRFGCDCQVKRPYNRPCVHVVAMLLYDADDKRTPERDERDAGGRMLDALIDTVPEEFIRLKAELDTRTGGVQMSLYAGGDKRFYVVRNIPQFMENWEKGMRMEMGKQLTIDPRSQAIAPDSLLLFDFIQELCQPGFSGIGYGGRYIALRHHVLRRFFDTIGDGPFQLQTGAGKKDARIINGAPDISFDLESDGREMVLITRSRRDIMSLTSDFRYLEHGGDIYRLDEDEARALKALYAAGSGRMRFGEKHAESLVSEVLPTLERLGDVHVDEAISARIISEPLITKIYLDREGEAVSARIAFHYGRISYDPFQPVGEAEANDCILKRDNPAERTITGFFGEYGFRVRAGGVYLDGSGVPDFLLEGVPRLQGMAEVYITEALSRMRPRRVTPKGKVGFSRRGMLEFSLELEGVADTDHHLILDALSEKRSYVRLPDGQTLDLRGEDWDDTRAILEEGHVTRDIVELDRFRAMYVEHLLNASSAIAVDGEVAASNAALRDPEGIECPIEGLRPYQIRGFRWLTQLYRTSMGGILADEMGLGKTLQMIAAIQWAKEQDGRRPSLIVAPTSLLYNWLAEIERFAPELSAVALSGGKEKRVVALSAAAEHDILITTYAQLRRDIEELSAIRFRYAVLDEAQQIKNAQTVGANAAKQLDADVRFALTGTPMENHPGELWSLFDFILPGYMFDLEEFGKRYGGEGGLAKLSAKARPFLTRRLKTDVLSELPDKIEEIMICEMSQKQRQVYNATMAKAREEVDEAFRDGGGRARFKMLAALTRLRQICCDPSLYLEGYAGGSGKLEMLIELAGDALGAGHRILVFSQFVSMLKIIRARLDEMGVESMYLDGATPSAERLNMVDRFNQGEGSVFLISLRAGGTGLNLPSADTVIHYDPWWNPAIEDQATDRAHRIGQKSAVHVMRLITRDSIEEKVQKLKDKKREWIDSVVTAGESAPFSMTPEEIRALFR